MTVTLKGNYTRKEAQYKAKLRSFYDDTKDSKTRDIEATVSVIFCNDKVYETIVHTTEATTTTKMKKKSKQKEWPNAQTTVRVCLLNLWVTAVNKRKYTTNV